MDVQMLLATPVIIALCGSAFLGLLIGYLLGKSKENKRKMLALDEQHIVNESRVNSLLSEHDEKTHILKKASTNDIENLKNEHVKAVDQVNTGHQQLVDSLKASHLEEMAEQNKKSNALVEELNKTALENVKDIHIKHEEIITGLNEQHKATIEKLYQKQAEVSGQQKEEAQKVLEMLKTEQAKTVELLTKQNSENVKTIKAEYEQKLTESADAKAKLQYEHDEEIGIVEARNKIEVDVFRMEITTLETDIAELNAQIKEAKQNNMFSLSKSGDKLISVVRSIQDLASELDETTKTVTEGEYSFFDQLKNQRGKDTLLSLTGIDPAKEQQAESSEATEDVLEPEADVIEEPAVESEPEEIEADDEHEASDDSENADDTEQKKD